MTTIQTLQQELFHHPDTKLINNGMIAEQKSDAFHIEQIESARRMVQHPSLNPDSPICIILDNYEKPLGAARLTVTPHHDCHLEFSNNITIPIQGGIVAEDLFNTLYHFFGENHQKVRMTSFFRDIKYFPYQISEIDGDFIKNMESKIEKSIPKTIDPILFADDKILDCKGCKCWNCGSGKTCNFLAHTCK